MNILSNVPLTPQEELIQEMESIFAWQGEERWSKDMEDSLFDVMSFLPDRQKTQEMIGAGVPWQNLSVDDLEKLKALSDKARGWAHCRNRKPEFVDMNTWKQLHDPANRLPRYDLK